jgi:hypothetical protein
LFFHIWMDWSLAIARNRETLLGIVTALFAMIGLGEGKPVERLPRPLHRAVLSLLRPAEAAVRRLIVVAARGLVVKPVAPRAPPQGLAGIATSRGRISFCLFDPRLRPGRPPARTRGPVPRLHVIDVGFDPRIPLFRAAPPGAPQPAPPPGVDAGPLCRRLAAVRRALEDLRSQARRYARWRSRPLERRRPRLFSALRPGGPPGFRKEVPHRVHAVLHECHFLAREVSRPDTS